jgi:hypothetical protein
MLMKIKKNWFLIPVYESKDDTDANDKTDENHPNVEREWEKGSKHLGNVVLKSFHQHSGSAFHVRLREVHHCCSLLCNADRAYCQVNFLKTKTLTVYIRMIWLCKHKQTIMCQ